MASVEVICAEKCLVTWGQGASRAAERAVCEEPGNPSSLSGPAPPAVWHSHRHAHQLVSLNLRSVSVHWGPAPRAQGRKRPPCTVHVWGALLASAANSNIGGVTGKGTGKGLMKPPEPQLPVWERKLAPVLRTSRGYCKTNRNFALKMAKVCCNPIANHLCKCTPGTTRPASFR